MGTELDIEDHGEASGTSSKSKILVLARYVKRQHALDQIIGDKLDGTMIRNKLEGTCLLTKCEPISVKDALDDES